eukprot:NODE_737_length_812_cov_11673.200524_g46_i1.p2 GENE.NODE_737_length_812_cov_11673.200524_g46_i1~~NODE_737_length_812_cov_11673.200524_g46_i1.p2  ORF type:complete len:51 (+),score=1.04 NODE_737_length_812_cov_11673.200524_g46_i1:530-682(+)
MWPWKLETSQECVTTHLPNQPAPKMDDAKVVDSYRGADLVTGTSYLCERQ